jgi:predicted transcriptional regulator
MARITIRIDDDLCDRLGRRARRVGVTISELVRPALEQAADPKAGYVFSSQDEILAGVLQTLSIVAAAVRSRSPEVLDQGMADAHVMLLEKGLLASGEQP